MSKIRLIRHEGGSRVMVVSSIVPKDWVAVEAVIIKQTNDSIVVKINRVK